MIIHITTYSGNKQEVARDIALGAEMGIYVAQHQVDTWFEKFSEFVYNKDNGDLLFYQLKTRAYWETDKEILKKYSK